MAVTGTKISQLDPAGALVGTEVTPIVQSGATVKTTLKAIADLEKEEIINDLTTGGATKFASAETVKTLGEEKVDKVAGKSLILDTEIARLSGVTNQTKQTLGLENVDNTSDLNKPVSTETQTALNGKVNTTDIEQVRSQATNKVASSKLLDDELTKVTNTERPIADIFAYLLGRIETLEELLVASRYNAIQVNELSVVDNIKFKGADLFLFGTAAPAVTPDFIGQFFIDTVGGVTYQAKGITNAGDWKQTSN